MKAGTRKIHATLKRSPYPLARLLVKHLLLDRGVTIRQLATRCETTVQTIHRTINGEHRNVALQQEIADALGVPLPSIQDRGGKAAA